MNHHEPYDLEKQLSDLLKAESMLAFFDFTLQLPGRSPASGIAKIAKPRKTKNNARYLAVLFIVDTPSLAARESISAAFAHMNWQVLAEGGLSGCKSLVAIPYSHAGTDHYFLETDIYLNNSITPDQEYLEESLMPALCRVTRIKAGEPTMWNDPPAQTGPVAALFTRIRKIFSQGQPVSRK